MKTRWGACNPAAGRIWLNLELIKKPASCLEYIVVHEMVHLLERRHNEQFRDLMNKFMPNWQFQKDLLNELPARHEKWMY
jgi:predicted metal-dependent hydrolase